MGTLTMEEFACGAEALVDYCRKFNARTTKVVDMQLVSTEKPYLSAAPVYLKLGEQIDIAYSLTFQVPVPYFCGQTTTRTLYNIDSNAMLSVAEHPITGLPCLFFHPCQSATVMAELGAGRDPLEYILKWLGAYNHLLGLGIPNDFFTSPSQTSL